LILLNHNLLTFGSLLYGHVLVIDLWPDYHRTKHQGGLENAQACDCSSYGHDVRGHGDRRSGGGRDRNKDDAGQLGISAANSAAGMGIWASTALSTLCPAPPPLLLFAKRSLQQ
jgi:hypothetical protein